MAYRARWHQRHAVTTEELEWLVAGSVWAADFTDPPMPIDGCFPNLLAARDLASRMQLEALPVLHHTGGLAADAMDALFLTCGPPMVFKSESGSPFKARDGQEP